MCGGVGVCGGRGEGLVEGLQASVDMYGCDKSSTETIAIGHTFFFIKPLVVEGRCFFFTVYVSHWALGRGIKNGRRERFYSDTGSSVSSGIITC